MPTIRKVSATRHTRPSVRRLALEYHTALDALCEAFREYDGCAPYSEQWMTALARVKACSDRVQVLSDRLFRQSGYSVALWVKLKRGVVE